MGGDTQTPGSASQRLVEAAAKAAVMEMEHMPTRETRARRGLLRAACLGFAVIAAAGATPAQGPLGASTVAVATTGASGDAAAPGEAPGGATSGERERAEMDELRTMVRVLEARVKELEGRLAAPATAQPASAPAAPPVASEAAAAEPPAEPPAEPTQAEVPPFFRNVEISGYVDFYYGYNLNGVDSQLNTFNPRHNQFAVNQIELDFERKPTEDSRLGFRTDFSFGPGAEIVHSFEPGGNDVFRHLQQAYVSYLAPVGKGLQVDVGKFNTPIGAEVIETKDNWNYSRSILFGYAIPFYHAGLRATYPVNDKLSVAGFLVNGWNNVVDNNEGKTVGFQAIVKPTDKLTLIQNYMTGPEQADIQNDGWRHIIDTTLVYNATPALSLMANYDYGMDEVLGTGVHWQGVALYGRYQANSWLAFSPRFEWYDDHDGYTTGLKQTLKEFTLTSEHKIAGSLITRLEYRRDWSDEDFFFKSGDRLVDAQSTLTFGVIYAFSSFGDK